MSTRRLAPWLRGTLLLALSVGVIGLAARRTDRSLRVELLQQARLVTQALDMGQIKALSATAADLATPGYQRLKEQLMAIGSANADCRWFYLLGRKADGTVFIFVDSEPRDAKDASPPGQVYDEVPAGYRRVFDTHTEAVVGPVADRWGRWVSALVPLTDPADGALVAVLGMDIDARIWWWRVAASMVFPASLMLVLLIGAAVVLVVHRPVAPSPKPLMRRLLPPLAATLGLLLAGALALLWQQHRQRLAAEIATDLTEISGDLRAAIGQQVAVLAATVQPIAADAAVQQALRQGDADRLLAAWHPVFEVLQRENHLTHFYFLDSHRICLLRLHQPAQRGDPVNHLTALTAEQTHTLASGIELGVRGTFALRVAQPVLAGGTLVGYVELGVEIGEVLQTLYPRFGHELAITIHKEYLTRETWEAGMRQLGRQAEWDRLPGSVVSYASQGRLPDAFLPWAEHGAAENHDQREADREVVSAGRAWRVAATPLRDTSGREVGDLLVMRDVSAAKAAFARLITLSGTAGVVLLALLLGVLYVLLWRADAASAAQQAELRASQEWHRTVVDTAMDGFWLADATGRLLECNEAYCRMSGYSAAELQGMRIADLEVIESQDSTAAHMQKIAAQDQDRFESRHRRQDGTFFDVEVSVQFRPVNGGRFLAFLRDITRRKRAQEERARSERRYRELVERANSIILRWTRDGEITFLNEFGLHFFGYTEAEILGRHVLGTIVPETESTGRDLRPLMDRICADPQAFENNTNENMRRNGEKVWVAWTNKVDVGDHGQVAGIISVGTDVTERQRAQEELRRANAVLVTREGQVRTLLAESNQARQALLGILEDQARGETERKRLETAIEQAAEAIVVTDTQGLMQYVNPAFVTMTGYTRAEAIGQNPRLLKSGQQDPVFYRELWGAVAAGRTWSGRIVNRRKDGTSYTVEATVSPVRDDAGQTVSYVAVQRDITEHLRVSGELQQAQKMETVGRLAGGVAHDFNNLLQGIMNYVDQCRDGLPPEHPVRESLDEITKNAQRSAEITGQLLAFARKQPITPKVLDLNDTVSGLLSLLRQLTGEGVDLAWVPGANLCPVMLDPTQVVQIMTNLCANARDAVAGTGKITIETANVTFDEAYCTRHVGIVPGGYVRLAVSDNGCGMDKDVVAHLFEPFFTTKDVGSGTGMGLATVYGIVTQNHGCIEVYSEPGKGTTFTLSLPRYVGAAPEPPATPAAGRPAATGRPLDGQETILLVEDEKAVRVTTRIFLSKVGYTVLAAEDPAEALRLADAHPGPIHLLITDVIMPGMNGRDLAKQLVERRPALRCLFMSGYTADVIVRHGMLDAGMQFLSKPFSRNELASKVREVLEASGKDA
jgi:PAS domain S-box-containing protein